MEGEERFTASQISRTVGPKPFCLSLIHIYGSSKSLYAEQRKLKLSPEDYETFEKALEQAFDALAEHYYLKRSDAVKIRTGSDKVTITIPFETEH